MLYEQIDHVILPVASLDAAAAPYARLGLRLTPRLRHRDQGTENRVFFVGDESDEFYVELLGIADADEARRSRGDTFLRAVEEGRGLSTVVVRVHDLPAAMQALTRRGVGGSAHAVCAGDGRKICDVAELDAPERASVALRLIQYAGDTAARYARHVAAGYLDHAFPLKRLDHLATVTPDLEGTTRFWTDVLGVPVTGEVVTAAMVIRQLTIGDAVLELLGPTTPDSPVARRPPGLVSMAAFAVDGLDAAVAQARAAGFAVPDPAPGVLPGTRTATIPADQLANMAMQLLEYV